MNCNEVDGKKDNKKNGEVEAAQQYRDTTDKFFHPVAGN